MHGLADTTADVLAALRHATRWRMAVASAPNVSNARRFRFAQPDIEQFEYG